MQLIYSGKTDIGLEREVNQDSFGAAHLEWGHIFVVADGFGHREGGKFASSTAVDLLIDNYSEAPPRDLQKFIRDSIYEIHDFISFKRKSKYNNKLLGSTLVCVIIQEKTAFIVHVGDSRIYRLRHGVLEQLTIDHSYVQKLIDKGEITEKEARFHKKRNVLTSALGYSKGVKFGIRQEKIIISDQYFLCSDGLWGMVSENDIKDVLKNSKPDTSSSQLINLAKINGGIDNITVEVIRFKL